MSDYYTYKPGLGAVGEYQSASKPFLSGNLDVTAGPYRVEFPKVTSWLFVTNHDATNDLNVAFSENGLPSQGGTNYYTIKDAQANENFNNMSILPFKVTEVWLEGANACDVVAGLTGIDTSAIVDNWSGSSGVG